MTMIFTNRRLKQTALSTIGKLDDLGWGCDLWILEPGTHGAPHARVKAGDYPLELRATIVKGQPYGKYAQFLAEPKLRNLILQGLPHLVMVPDRLALIHPGNTYRDSEACALPGLGRLPPNLSNSQEWEVTRSQDALVRLYPFLQRAIASPGGAVWRVLDPVEGL